MKMKMCIAHLCMYSVCIGTFSVLIITLLFLQCQILIKQLHNKQCSICSLLLCFLDRVICKRYSHVAMYVVHNCQLLYEQSTYVYPTYLVSIIVAVF